MSNYGNPRAPLIPHCASRPYRNGNVLLMTVSRGCRYPGGADAAALSELRNACAGALRYAQERNAYADEGQGQAALVVSWQAAVEVTFTRRWDPGPGPCHIADCRSRPCKPCELWKQF